MIAKKGWPQFAAMAVIVCSVFLTSGCGAATEEQKAEKSQTDQNGPYSPSDLQEIHVPLRDGTTTTCLIGYYKLFCFDPK